MVLSYYTYFPYFIITMAWNDLQISALFYIKMNIKQKYENFQNYKIQCMYTLIHFQYPTNDVIKSAFSQIRIIFLI